MGDRRPKKRKSKRDEAKPSLSSQVSKLFIELGLRECDFEIEAGKGKSFLSGQRIVWMHVTHLSSGRKISDRIGTTKKAAPSQFLILLRDVLREF